MESFFEMVPLILVGVFILVCLIGFLTGMVRGMKRSALRLAFTIGFLFIAGFLTPWVSGMLLNDLDLSFIGLSGSVTDVVMDMLAGIPQFSEMMTASPTLAALIGGIPVVFLNFIVFIMLALVLNTIGFIIYSIIAAIFVKKHTKVVVGDKVEKVKKKKYALIGGVIGIVQSLVLVFGVLIPVGGMISTAGDIINQHEVYAATEDNYSDTAKMLRDLMGEDVVGLIDAYNYGPFGITHQAVSFGNIFFDGIMSVDINGQVLVLREQLKNIANIYNDVAYLMSLFEDPDLVYADINFVRVNRVVDNIFNISGTGKIGAELTVYFINSMAEDMIAEDGDANIAELLSSISETLAEDPNLAATLKSDVKAIVNILEVLCKAGVVDEFVKENPDLDLIADMFAADGNKAVKDIIDGMYGSKTLRMLIVEGLNYGIGLVEDMIDGGSIARIDESRIKWTADTQVEGITKNVATETFNFVSKALEIVPIASKLTDGDISVKAVAGSLEIAGDLLDMIKDSPMFKAGVNNTDVYLSVINALNNSEKYNKWFDFNVLKADGVFKAQFKIVGDFLEVFGDLTDADAEINFAGFDYDAMEKVIDDLIASAIFNGIKIDFLLDLKEDYLADMEEGMASKILEAFFEEIDESSDGMHEVIAVNLKTVYKVVSLFGKSGILDIAISGQMDASAMLACFKDTEKTEFNSVIDDLIDRKVIKVALKELMDEMVTGIDSDIEPKNIEDINWASTKSGLKGIINDLYDAFDILEGSEIELDEIMNNLIFILSDEDLCDSLFGTTITEGLLPNIFTHIREIDLLVDTNNVPYVDIILKGMGLEGLTESGEPQATFLVLGNVAKHLRDEGIFADVFGDDFTMTEEKQEELVKTIIDKANMAYLVDQVVESNFLTGMLIEPLFSSMGEILEGVLPGAGFPEEAYEWLGGQKSEFSSIVGLVFDSLSVFENFDYETSDKSTVAALLDALKENRYRREIADNMALDPGIFGSVYDSILNLLRSQLGLTFDAAYNSYAEPWFINFGNLFNLIDTMQSVSFEFETGDFTLPSEIFDALGQIVTDMICGPTGDPEVKEIIESIFDSISDISTALTGSHSEGEMEEILSDLISDLESYDEGKIDEVVDILQGLTGFDLSKLKDFYTGSL